MEKDRWTGTVNGWKARAWPRCTAGLLRAGRKQRACSPDKGVPGEAFGLPTSGQLPCEAKVRQADKSGLRQPWNKRHLKHHDELLCATFVMYPQGALGCAIF